METNNSSSTSSGSAFVGTDSQLPIACSEVNNSAWASVDGPSCHRYMTAASCSPWQSGSTHGMVLRSDCRERGETDVKPVAEPAANISLRSDAGAVQNARSSEPQMPYYVDYGDAGSTAQNLISLHTDFDDARRNVNQSGLSHDGIDDMTVVDASPEYDWTSAQPGCLTSLCMTL